MCTKNKSFLYQVTKNVLFTIFSQKTFASQIELMNRKGGKNSTEETIRKNKVSQLKKKSCFNKQILDGPLFFVHTLFQFTKQHVQLQYVHSILFYRNKKYFFVLRIFNLFFW